MIKHLRTTAGLVGWRTVARRPFASVIAARAIPSDPRPERLTLRQQYRRLVYWPSVRLTRRVAFLRYVNVYRIEQAYGGAEEGGWWYNEYHPLSTRRCFKWNVERVRKAVQAATTKRKGRGYSFRPAPADTDPMTDYTEADKIGTRFDAGETTRKVERHPARHHSDYKPWC